MKNIALKKLGLVAALVLFSGASMAEFTQFGAIHFQKDNVWVSADKTYIKDGFIYAQQPKRVRVCPHDPNTNSDPACTWVKGKLLSQPVVSTKTECAVYDTNTHSEGDCARWETVEFNQAGDVRAQVWASHYDYIEGQRMNVIPLNVIREYSYEITM